MFEHMRAAFGHPAIIGTGAAAIQLPPPVPPPPSEQLPAEAEEAGGLASQADTKVGAES